MEKDEGKRRGRLSEVGRGTGLGNKGWAVGLEEERAG